VGQKQKNCDPTNLADDHPGDGWDPVAIDPEHRLALAVVPGARSMENGEAILADVEPRTGDAPRWIPSEESPANASAIEAAFGAPAPPGPLAKPGRRPLLPERRLPDEWTSATVQGLRIKIRRMGKVEKPSLESDFDQYPEKPGDFLNIVTEYYINYNS